MGGSKLINRVFRLQLMRLLRVYVHNVRAAWCSDSSRRSHVCDGPVVLEDYLKIREKIQKDKIYSTRYHYVAAVNVVHVH